MTVQINVGLYQAEALPGQKATPTQFIYPAVMPISKGTVTVGNFVWLDATGVDAAATGTGVPLGIVERVIQYSDFKEASPGTIEVLDKTPLTVGIRGDYWVKTTTTAAVGQSVYANITTGAVAAGNTGTSVSGATETPWKVLTAGAVGDMIKISNWGKGL